MWQAAGRPTITGRRLRLWQWVHRWSSLVCTAFLLLLCITGLPLIFADELDVMLGDVAIYAPVPSDVPRPSVDELATRAHRLYPNNAVRAVFIDREDPRVLVFTTPDLSSPDRTKDHWLRFDARTGAVLGEQGKDPTTGPTFIGIIRSLHGDLLLGSIGEIVMIIVGTLFVVAIISGVALYGPYTRKLPFGAVRQRSKRVQWLDLHNLLGIVTLAWASVVGLTGIMNELTNPLVAVWQKTDVQKSLAAWKGQGPLDRQQWASFATVQTSVERAYRGQQVWTIYVPGDSNGSPRHFLVWTRGMSPLTERLGTPILVDGRTGQPTMQVNMPWYLRFMELSRPLHYGDYGGLPLKIIWALLDVVTIIVLGSGLYLWIARPRREKAAAGAEGLHGASPVMEPAE